MHLTFTGLFVDTWPASSSPISDPTVSDSLLPTTLLVGVISSSFDFTSVFDESPHSIKRCCKSHYRKSVSIIKFKQNQMHYKLILDMSNISIDVKKFKILFVSRTSQTWVCCLYASSSSKKFLLPKMWIIKWIRFLNLNSLSQKTFKYQKNKFESLYHKAFKYQKKFQQTHSHFL